MKWKVLTFGAMLAAQSSAVAQAPASESVEPLLLECPGELTVTNTITAGDGDDVRVDQKAGASVQVEITDGAGRVHFPKKILPVINSGTDGWFTLSNLKNEPDHISADVRINFITTVKVEIDRRTGRIEIGSAFYGRCDRRPTTNRF